MLFQAAVFLHVATVIGLFIAFGCEWLAISQLKRADNIAVARSWVGATKSLPALALGSLVIILLTGIYLAMVTQLFQMWWLRISFLVFILLGPVGAIAGRRLRELRSGKDAATDVAWFTSRANNGALQAALRLQLTMTLAIVFMMTARPGLVGSIAWSVGSVVVGLLWSLLGGKKS